MIELTPKAEDLAAVFVARWNDLKIQLEEDLDDLDQSVNDYAGSNIDDAFWLGREAQILRSHIDAVEAAVKYFRRSVA